MIELEEQHLRAIFSDYADYAERVPVLWPSLGAKKFLRNPNRFRIGLYLRNQEYQAAIGFLAGFLVLLWKVL